MRIPASLSSSHLQRAANRKGRNRVFGLAIRCSLLLALVYYFLSIRVALNNDEILPMRLSDEAWIPQPDEKSSSLHSPKIIPTVEVPGFVEFHNQTVDGAHLPGPFQKGLLFILGARWTTLYDDPDFLSVTLFTMPGDFFRRKKEGKVRCQPNHLKSTLLEFEHVFHNVSMYTQLDCQGVPCGDPIRMEAIDTSQSPDANQNKVTQIWTANVTHLMTHAQLRELSNNHPSQNHAFSAIRVHFWTEHGWPLMGGNFTLHDSIATNWDPKEIVPSSNRTFHALTKVDIPIETGVVGQAGPSTVARNNQHSEKPILCTGAYGQEARHYYPTFIQHHLNVGFGSVVIGLLDATVGSPQWTTTRDLLQPYIQRGQVHMAALELTDIECEVNIRKVHLYNFCLHHAKGLSPYLGIWDLDEMWVPPIEGKNEFFSKYQQEPKWNDSTLFEHDDLWRNSPYTLLPNVVDSLNALSAYQSSFGCGDWFCFQGFPSNVIFRRRANGSNSELVEQMHDLRHDFERMDDFTDWKWSKSITRTGKAEMGGIHVPGACRSEGEKERYVPRDKVNWSKKLYNKSKARDQTCRNLLTLGFGNMHHYYTMLRYREYDNDGDRTNLNVSTYHMYFANTVQAQLQRLGFKLPSTIP